VGPLRRASVRQSQLAFGPSFGGSVFGVNWVILQEPDVGYTVFHNGSTGDYSASVWMAPTRQIAVIALAGSGNNGQLDALAKHILSVLATAAPEPPPELATPVETALARVLQLFVKADVPSVQAAFTPKFLSTIPVDKLVEMIDKVSKAVGTCHEHEAVRVQSATEAIVRVHCERGTIDLNITTEAKPPYLLDGLLVQPAKP
jgi:hypothetical protein